MRVTGSEREYDGWAYWVAGTDGRWGPYCKTPAFAKQHRMQPSRQDKHWRGLAEDPAISQEADEQAEREEIEL